jgi:hypothetical protein
MEASGQLHAPAALPPKERAPGTHWIRVWMGARTVLDAVVKRKITSPRRESNLKNPIVHITIKDPYNFECVYKITGCYILVITTYCEEEVRFPWTATIT